ncbi:histidine kinase, partial [Paenibacillus sepulcri]|nr:histidine kinase [Paenibacillus sepulcri]
VRDKLVFIIRDDGVGMDKHQLETIFSERRTPPSKDRFTGIGIMNVHERIRLHYGQPYGLRVFSLPMKGMLVRVELPAVKPDEFPPDS